MILRTNTATTYDAEAGAIEFAKAKANPLLTWSERFAESPASTGPPDVVPIQGARPVAKWVRGRLAAYSLALSATSVQPPWVSGNVTMSIAGTTAQENVRERVELVVERLVMDANAQFLEDGMTAWLGDSIESYLTLYGSDAVETLRDQLERPNVEADTASHILRWLGRAADRRTFGDRLHVLTAALESPLPVVRDGAALALGEMDSPRAIPKLRAAIAREPRQGLREDMDRVLRRLERQR